MLFFLFLDYVLVLLILPQLFLGSVAAIANLGRLSLCILRCTLLDLGRSKTKLAFLHTAKMILQSVEPLRCFLAQDFLLICSAT